MTSDAIGFSTEQSETAGSKLSSDPGFQTQSVAACVPCNCDPMFWDSNANTCQVLPSLLTRRGLIVLPRNSAIARLQKFPACLFRSVTRTPPFPGNLFQIS